ncbi:MAG: hypothetical protein J3R72DRAFT_442655 [Linnemannia gamsii]|nr:MAG: hypothetical protein J3R72DRAFT_442655 [Linnemannia gamsii]
MDALPEECIVHILSFATPGSLHALLLTNRTLFRLTAVALYNNPFEYLERQVTDRQARQVKVLRLFLACAPDTLDAITTASSSSSDTSLPGFRKPTIDYLALYSCHFEKLLQFLITPALACIPSAISATLSPQQDPSQKQPGKLSLPSEQSLPVSQAQPRRIIQRLDIIPRRIDLGLVGHTPQHIHTIGYSIHGLATLLPLVDQLSRLVRLELYKKKGRREISTATEVISAHRRVHQSLQEIKIKNDDQSDLTPLVQAMGQPHTIDVSNWANADLYLHLFPLQQCRVLLMRQGFSRSASSIPVDILAGLMNAQVLRMPAFHQHMFSWAIGESVEPKRVLSERGFVLPSLTSISLYGLDTHMVAAFADSIAAFQRTLQTLVGLSSFGSFDEPSPVALSWSHSLPRLTRLDLEGTIALCFDLTCLGNCPVLRELRLKVHNTGMRVPEDWDPCLKAQQLAQVSPSLRSLEIAGRWHLPANCFTETLLPVFQRLRRLNVMWCDGPTVDVLLQLVTLLPSLSWLGIIATHKEHSQVLDHCAYIHPSLELDVHISDE